MFIYAPEKLSFITHPVMLLMRCRCSRSVDVVAVKERVSSLPVRVASSAQRFARCKLKAGEKTPYCSSGRLYVFWCLAPPLSQGIVGRGVGGARGI